MTDPISPYNDYHTKKKLDDLMYATSVVYSMNESGGLTPVHKEYVIPDVHKLVIEREFIAIMNYHGFSVSEDDNDNFKIRKIPNRYEITLLRSDVLLFNDVLIKSIKNHFKHALENEQLGRH